MSDDSCPCYLCHHKRARTPRREKRMLQWIGATTIINEMVIAWLGMQVPLGIFVGKFIKWGDGQ